MSPINTASAQQTQAAQQPAENFSKNFDTTLRVAGAALAALAVGAVLFQLPGDLVVAGVVLIGFATLTCLCIATIANSPCGGNSVLYTPGYRPRPWSFFGGWSPVHCRPPEAFPLRTITLPSYRPAPAQIPAPISFRPAPMPARGIDPRPMREPVGIRRR